MILDEDKLLALLERIADASEITATSMSCLELEVTRLREEVSAIRKELNYVEEYSFAKKVLDELNWAEQNSFAEQVVEGLAAIRDGVESGK